MQPPWATPRQPLPRAFLALPTGRACTIEDFEEICGIEASFKRDRVHKFSTDGSLFLGVSVHCLWRFVNPMPVGCRLFGGLLKDGDLLPGGNTLPPCSPAH